MLVLALLKAFWFFLPAYIANPTAVLFGGGTPIDFGKVLRDGNRLFGDGKTWRGFGGGVMCGIILGLILWGIATAFYPQLSFGPFPEGLVPIILLPIGALLGDLAGSYIKRRIGKARGAPVIGLDQYDFFVFAILLIMLFQTGWFLQHYWYSEGIYGLLFITILTPFLHKLVNVVGYKIGKK